MDKEKIGLTDSAFIAVSSESKYEVQYKVNEKGFLNITPEGIVLREIHPEFTVEQVQEATGATLIISPELKPMKQ